MVLDNATTEKIKSLVYQKPRSINELALALDKNWRTVDRYVEEIMLRTGTIRVTTFRGGTRGALKIVYWNNTEKIYSSDVQERLFKQIELGIEKSDFSPFEIYQYVDADKRVGTYEEIVDEKNYAYNMGALGPFFEHAEAEICIFAGNLAFIHATYKGKTFFKLLEDCVRRKISVKIITYVYLADRANVEKVLSLNAGLKQPLVEVRHEITPLRCYVFDSTVARLGEIYKAPGREGQIKRAIGFYYEIRDKEWVEWIQKVFWKKFQNAIPASMRLANLASLKKL